jgi:hypothetical protein
MALFVLTPRSLGASFKSVAVAEPQSRCPAAGQRPL